MQAEAEFGSIISFHSLQSQRLFTNSNSPCSFRASDNCDNCDQSYSCLHLRIPCLEAFVHAFRSYQFVFLILFLLFIHEKKSFYSTVTTRDERYDITMDQHAHQLTGNEIGGQTFTFYQSDQETPFNVAYNPAAMSPYQVVGHDGSQTRGLS